jgi:signal transduction histidine kinase
MNLRMNKPLRLLLLEDSETDAALLLRELQRQGYEPECLRVAEEASFRAALEAQSWEVILAEYSLPGFGALAALNCLRKTGLDLPFIIVSGTLGEQDVVATMKAGAQDYIFKDRLARLAPAIERELREAAIRRERQQAENELRDSREQLRALAARLESVREEERKRITRDIHDAVGSALTALKMDLAWICHRLVTPSEPDCSTVVLRKIGPMMTLIDTTSDTIRKLCSELRPGILDDLGLAAALEWQAREFARRTGVPCRVEITADTSALNPDQSTAIFRIFQEILTNVTRHAAATRVHAVLEAADGLLVLKASDNGRGIRPADAVSPKALGLLGMRERALALGGSLEIQPGAAGGTTLTLRVPLRVETGRPAGPLQPCATP